VASGELLDREGRAHPLLVVGLGLSFLVHDVADEYVAARRQIEGAAAGLADLELFNLSDDLDSRAFLVDLALRGGRQFARVQVGLDDDQLVRVLRPGVLGLDAGETERFLLVDPVEAPLDQVRISAESPPARALLGRPVGEQVEVKALSGRYRCRILATRRCPASSAENGHRTA
jgi:hypothetical protein